MCRQYVKLDYITAIAAQWQEWGQWSQCTASCGQGLKIRARACSQPASGGNEQCPGDSTEVEDCSSAECPGELMLWLPDLLGKKLFITLVIHSVITTTTTTTSTSTTTTTTTTITSTSTTTETTTGSLANPSVAINSFLSRG